MGGKLCDFDGVISRANVDWDVRRLIHGCGLRAMHFEHVTANQRPLLSYHRSLHDSPYMDLRMGFAAYCQSAAGGQRKNQTIGASEAANGAGGGAPRFVPHSCDRSFSTSS